MTFLIKISLNIIPEVFQLNNTEWKCHFYLQKPPVQAAAESRLATIWHELTSAFNSFIHRKLNLIWTIAMWWITLLQWYNNEKALDQNRNCPPWQALAECTRHIFQVQLTHITKMLWGKLFSSTKGLSFYIFYMITEERNKMSQHLLCFLYQIISTFRPLKTTPFSLWN